MSTALNSAFDVNKEDARHAERDAIQAISMNAMKLRVLKNILSAL